jgi:hypothetical protein
MNLEEIIQRIRATRSLPSDEDLRRLPYLKAFVYGRVSSQVQVRESRESIRDIAKLVMKVKQDGYKSNLNPDEVEKWLASIQSGADVNRVIEDGDIIVDCQDLGLSGSLGEDKRPGLAHLRRRVESGEVGAVYLTEGMSRLSRDRDRVLGYKLLKLLKEHQCRIRTVEGVYNPAIPHDWHHLAEDVDSSAEEMKTSGIRMGARRWDKAAEGKHVGSPVCPGYIVAIEGRKRDGSFVFGKWKLYSPHQAVVIQALEEIVKQRSLYRAFQVLWARHLVFPFFGEGLEYMQTRSALRFYHKDSTGYLISYNALKGLATNLNLVGIWQWRDVLIVNNHDPAVPVDLFEQAYEIATSPKRKGRAAYAEPMEWAGQLYCYDHDEPRRVSALNRERRWACRSSIPVPFEAPCLQIADHFLTPPLTRAFLECLDLTPHAEAILEKLKSEVSQNNLGDSQRRKREAEIKAHIANLERYLGTSDDPEREETYWRLISEEKRQLELLRQKPAAPKATPLDLDRVAQFLENLDREWERYPSRLRNRLIKLLIDRVELRHDVSHIEAVICWKIGLKQAVNIRRPATNFAKEKVWRVEEENLLRMLWPSSSREAIMAAFPNRTWEAIGQRAGRLKISRQWVRVAIQKSRRWTNEEKEKLRELYSSKASVDDIARELGRSRGTVISMAHVMGLSRPKELRYRRREPAWEPITIKLFQESSSLS